MEGNSNHIYNGADTLLPSYEAATSEISNNINHTVFHVEKGGSSKVFKDFINYEKGIKYKIKTKFKGDELYVDGIPIYKLSSYGYSTKSNTWKIIKLSDKGFRYNNIELKQHLSAIGLLFTLTFTTDDNIIKELEWEPTKERFFTWILRDLKTSEVIMKYIYKNSKSDTLTQYYNLEKECLRALILSLSIVVANGNAFQRYMKAVGV